MSMSSDLARKTAFFERLKRLTDAGWDEREAKRRRAHRQFFTPAPTPRAADGPPKAALFSGLAFFYIPDDEVAPARRLRIRRAREHGARRVRSASSATHVVVDKGLAWRDVAGLLGHTRNEKVVVVNEDWPLECMQYGALVDAGQRRYGVPGMRDELAECITMARGFGDLPLEEEEEEEEEDHEEDKEDKDEEEKGEGGFACLRAGEGPNQRTMEMLEGMRRYYEGVGDTWRALAYRKAVGVVGRQTEMVRTRDEALRLPGIGARLADEIEEIATTQRLRRLEGADTAAARAVSLFRGIYGVGSRLAGRWAAQGLRTLEDVRATRWEELTGPQRVGLERHADLARRIPRAEVAALGEVVRKAAVSVDPSARVVVGGSYRRGAATSHDVDIVLTKEEEEEDDGDVRGLLGRVVGFLEADGFLVARLAGSAGGGTWHGCCVMPGEGPRVWRRIDFLAVPGRELGAAMIYFTGDDVFNRSMRLLAARRGMRLNQRGLYDAGGGLIEGRDERRIFAVLGVPWREPHERWC